MAKNHITSEDAVTADIEISATPERVFQALTDQKQLVAWWGSEPSVELTTFEMNPNRGGQWRYTCKPRPGHVQGAVEEQMRRGGETQYECHGEVLESIPPRLLVWSWIANWHDRPDQRTVVRWEIEPTKTGTRVRVTHSGLAQLPVARKDYGKGWEGALRLLQTFLQRSGPARS
ncbi:MAG: SRPBCC domain-containing protein [Gemmatimonadetes bacterium]|nr:SRPBCC domain-containing protein [Gemmatimonadota bacterium]